MSVVAFFSRVLFWFTFLGLCHSLARWLLLLQLKHLFFFFRSLSSLGCCRSPCHGFIYDLFTIIHLLGNTISSLMSTPVASVAMLITPLHDIYHHWNWCWQVVCTNLSHRLPDRGYGHQPIMQPRYLQNNLRYRHLALKLLPQWQLCRARSPHLSPYRVV